MTNQQYRVVFMGSPQFSRPILQALEDNELFNVVGVVTQPDRPKGRGRKLIPPPVKELAQTLTIPVVQPNRLRKDKGAKEQLHSWAPDVMVVAAFGQLLKPDVLDLPEHGCINVHTSLLPRWRGASPIQAALLHGDEVTGVTIMKMDTGMDTGPILSQEAYKIPDGITYVELETVLSSLGAALLMDTLPDYMNGKITLVAQDGSLATKAPLINKKDGLLDFSQPGKSLVQKVRAFNPWPSAYTLFHGQNFKILKAHYIEDQQVEKGTLLIKEKSPAIGCADGWLVLDEVQLAGKKQMDGAVFLRGNREKWLDELG
ncbi:MAG: methionyl-tRNA formyltransferase [Anaerolineaceae bacterium]|nr:methionyl-tRNA formyltransferase [Anaerolineaceae bacterium]